MTSTEKAHEVANYFVTKSVFDMDKKELKLQRKLAKKHANYYVDGIIEQLERVELFVKTDKDTLDKVLEEKSWWQDVKYEIDKLNE